MLFLLAFLSLISVTVTKAVKPHSGQSSAISHAFDVCNLKDAKACSSHGTCASYLRADKKPATRCQCNYPYVGETCGKKRFEAVKKKLKEESSSSSSSSETSSSESSDESESSDSDDSAETSESSDSSSSSSDLSSSSDSEEDSWGGNEDHHDRRHRETHEWSGWLMGIVFLVLICCCIGGLFWFMWRPTRVVKISGRA